MTKTKRKAAAAAKPKSASKRRAVPAAVGLEVRLAKLEAVVQSLASQLTSVQDHVARVDNAAGEYVLKLENAVTELQAAQIKKKPRK